MAWTEETLIFYRHQIYQLYLIYFTLNQEFCPPFWDEASCFPPTLANTEAIIPCMSSYGSERYNTSCKYQLSSRAWLLGSLFGLPSCSVFYKCLRNFVYKRRTNKFFLQKKLLNVMAVLISPVRDKIKCETQYISLHFQVHILSFSINFIFR